MGSAHKSGVEWHPLWFRVQGAMMDIYNASFQYLSYTAIPGSYLKVNMGAVDDLGACLVLHETARIRAAHSTPSRRDTRAHTGAERPTQGGFGGETL